MIVTPKRNCANCGKLFYQKDPRALYCCNACRTASFRKRKKADAADIAPETKENAKSAVWETRTVTTNVRNPVYSNLEAVLTNEKAKLEKLKNEERQLNATKEETEDETEPSDIDKYYKPALVWGGTTTILGVIGSLMFPTKSDNNPESKPFEKRFFLILVLVVVAVLVGIAFEESRRHNNAKKLPKVVKRLNDLPEEIEQADRLVKRLTAELDIVPKTIEREKEERFAVSKPVEATPEIAKETSHPEPV